MSKSKRTALRTIWYYAKSTKPYRWKLIVNVSVVVVGTIVGSVLFRYYLATLFEKLSGYKGGSTEDVYSVLWLLLGLVILEVACWRINDFVMLFRHAAVLRDLEQTVFNKLQVHSYRFFSNNFAGSITTQFNRFIRSYMHLDRILFIDILMTLVDIAASTIVLMFIAPVLGVIMLGWSVLFITSMVFLTIKKSPYTRIEAEADSKVTANIADSITNIINIKTFAREDEENKRFTKVSQDRYKKRIKSWLLDAHIRSWRWFMVIIFMFSYLLLSVHLVVTDTVSVGVVLAAQLFMMSIYGRLFNLNQTIQVIEMSLSEAAEMTELLDTPYEVTDPAKPIKSNIKQGKIEFKNVTFSYKDGGGNVFENLDLMIKPGQKVGLVGSSGGGKSSLTRLILRFVDIKSGSILIDDQDISKLAQEDLRSSIAYVPQEPILFHRSLFENIHYGNPKATKTEVYNAAERARAGMFIDLLPEGYETLVGERGIKLSGGEKQRVAIARAMLSEAPVLLLDEATSALDSKSEKLITKALDELMAHRTTIVIAHRLSTIKKMDRILVMDDGKILEDGSHEELIKLKGKYAELWSHQSGDFLED